MTYSYCTCPHSPHDSTALLIHQSTPFLSYLIPLRYFSLAAPKDKPLYSPFMRSESVTASVYKASKDLRGSISFFIPLITHHIAKSLLCTCSPHYTYSFDTPCLQSPFLPLSPLLNMRRPTNPLSILLPAVKAGYQLPLLLQRKRLWEFRGEATKPVSALTLFESPTTDGRDSPMSTRGRTRPSYRVRHPRSLFLDSSR
jgi:hypothetical protein